MGYKTFLALLVTCVVGQVSAHRLLIILLDGFRWDYMEHPGFVLPGFKAMFEKGVRVKKLIPAYPSVSYPNHYTLLTGLYVESHGFVGNTIHDVTTNTTLSPWDTMTAHERAYLYDGAEPLWITAVKENKTAYMYHWVGCEAIIQGRQPTYCKLHAEDRTLYDFHKAVDDSLSLIKNSTANLAMIYYDHIDDYGHRYGPMTPQIKSALHDLDHELERLLAKIAELDLEDKLDVMIFSDHGMTGVSPKQVVNITANDIPMALIDTIVNGYGSHVFVWPKTGEGNVEKVFHAFRLHSAAHGHYIPYRKQDIPDRYHFKSHPRIPPILLAAQMPYYIVTPHFRYYDYDTGPTVGEHGYDPTQPDMAGFFTAFGPSFASGVVTESLPNVNLYQMMCKVMHMDPLPHNGTWSLVSHMMTDTTNGASTFDEALPVLLLMLAGIAALWKS